MQVQEAAAASEGFLRMPDAQLNLGILALALEKPKEAVQVLPPCLQAHNSLLCWSCHPLLQLLSVYGARLIRLPLPSRAQGRLQLLQACHHIRHRAVVSCVVDPHRRRLVSADLKAKQEQHAS